MVELIRSVVRLEMAAARGPALGVVTALHPHAAADDDFNDEVDVTLQHEGAELTGVPVAVGQPGTAAALMKGDLVLVQFLGGDLQQPLVTACFHTDAVRPPLHPEGEYVVEQRIDGKPRNRVRWATNGEIRLERLDSGGSANVTLVLDGEGNMQITAAGKNVTVTCKTFTVTGNAVIDGGNLDVTGGTVSAANRGSKTTIDGNTITGHEADG